ncbi:carboxypeptidase D, b isoform X2 [Brachyhypopomus gauderio]|uniref:carboxypeptidase D, b isoform X2 n=1 Tax=Brachyhypopomus gauderio TaxID=698409 RepID=UPI0040434052
MAYFCFIVLFFSISEVTHCVKNPFETDNEENYNEYYNYLELTRRLHTFVENYPRISSLGSVGKSVEGRELWVMRVTTHPITDVPGKPRVRYVGNMHGDEAVSRQVLVYLIEHLLTQYGTDPRVTALVNYTDIYIMPSMNPDGFEKAMEGVCKGNSAGRDNAKHVDLNRNFPDHFDATSALVNDAPEITGVIKWTLQRKFVLSGDLHGGSVMARYPFDDSDSHLMPGGYSPSHDDALYRHLAQTYTQNHPSMREGKPQCQDDPNEKFKDGVTNMADSHDVKGGMQYFSYLRGNCFEVTFELSCCKYPMASDLYTEWNNNREALLAYMEKVHIGVRGYVMTSSGIGLPDSNIAVAGIDHSITTWIFGDYYRLLLPGTYNITASSPGYQSKTEQNVKVNTGRATLLNFILEDLNEERPVLESPTTVAPTTARAHAFSNHRASTPEPRIHPQDSSYRSYVDMERILQQLSTIHSPITRLYSVGQSAQGRKLYVMEISTDPGTDQSGKPEVMLVGGLHGSDAVGGEILLNLVEYLCNNYGSEPLVTQLVNTTRVHILPSMNPDGYEARVEAQKNIVNENVGGGMGNSSDQSTDLNRNFPDISYARDFVQPETAAVMKWIKAYSFVLSATVLGGMIGIKYPSSVDSLDEAVLKSFTEAYYMENPYLQMSQACKEPRPLDRNDINRGFSAPTFSGIDLQTWAYRNTNTLGVSIGLTCDPSPPAENLLIYWKQNHNALLKYIQQVHFSVRGRVTDVHSGQAIANATIVVEGSRHRVHVTSTGQYWRPLASGMYRLHAYAPGYAATMMTVRVLQTQIEQVDFGLTPEQLPQFKSHMEDEEFRKLVESLSSAHTLGQLVQSLLPAGTLIYRNFKERSEFLRGLALNFPHITRLYGLGHSWEFRTIWALEISGSPESPRPTESKIRYVAGVHGNAAVGPELLMEFASVLCINYGWNPTITKLIDRSRIVIVPCVNPDGRELAQEGLCFSTAGRTNAHGVDLDTDFLYGNVSVQPETRAMMNLIEGGGFTLSVVLEGGSLLATYPYDRPTQSVQNEETLRYLASVYASNHPVMHLGYIGCSDELRSVPQGILRGADFNSHTGSMKDFSMDVDACPEVTVYTGCCLHPPPQQLLSLWAEHASPLFAMLVEVHKGVSGVVRGMEGQPVAGAVIGVNGSALVHTDTQGYFHTLLAPGTHQLQVQAPGFQQQLAQVNVSSHQMASPVLIQFTADSSRLALKVGLAVAISIATVVLCSLLVWRFRASKFRRIRHPIRWWRRRRDELRLDAILSEKSPLRRVFLEDSESDNDTFYLEQH